MAKARIKTPALDVAVPASKNDCAIQIAELGARMRDLTRLETAMNDAISAVTAEYEAPVNVLKNRIQTLQTGIQTWCEAHRQELTQNGKTKSGQFTTGQVQWRQRPPSITVRGIEAVLAWLEEKRLDRLIRVKREINKDALLNEPEVAGAVPGVRVVTGVEDFVVTPFEQEV